MNRILTLFIALLSAFAVKAEVWPIYSIVDLYLKSDRIVEATFYKEVGGNCVFLYKDLFSQSTIDDTLVLKDVNDIFNFKEDEALWKEAQATYISLGIDVGNMQRRALTFKDADKIIFFLCQTMDGTYVPVMSGYRIIKNNSVYVPRQEMIPGRYSFSQDTSVNEARLYENITRVGSKISYFEAIFEVEGQGSQSKLYASWLKRYVKDIQHFEYPGSNSSDGWGTVGLFFKYKMIREDIGIYEISFADFKAFIAREFNGRYF